MNDKIGIVTVLYNSGTVIEEFFETLSTQTYRNFVLYVVDNNSPDDSLLKTRLLAENASFKTVIFAEKENWGVAKGNNIGIEKALSDGCTYVLLSNNDVVLEPTTIENLLHGILATHVTMAVPKIYFHDTNLIWAAGAKFELSTGRTPHIGYKKEDKGQFDTPKLIEYSPTCFMLIKSAVFSRVGFMDELYFVYWDDTDFMWRATQSHHERLAYIPSSKLWHKESTCTEGKKSDFSIRYYHRNFMYMGYKHFSRFKRLRMQYYVQFKLLVLFFLKKITKSQYDLSQKSLDEGIQLYKKSSNKTT